MAKRVKKTVEPVSKFMHPSEAAFAGILDFYGIPWQYEPRTFALAWDETGRVTEAFSPDFYLPEQDLYVEVTTLRQHLITYKNRKLRRLRELHPEISIKLLTRADFTHLLFKYGLEESEAEIIGQQALSYQSQRNASVAAFQTA